MAKRLSITYGSLRQDTHDAVTVPYDPATFNFGYELEIHDRDYTGTLKAISEIGSDGAVISQKSGGANMNKIIVPSVLSFTMYINSTDEESFLTDLIDADEERFTIELYHRQQLQFRGYILIEQVSQDVTSSYRALNITAVDGLTRLKEVKYPIYEETSTLTESRLRGYPTFLETIVRCFEESNVSSLYSSTYPLFNVYTNWEESEMDFTNTDRPGLLDQIACQSNLFHNLSEENEEEVSITSSSNSFNCYKVLETILSILHCKIFYENGRYYIRHAWGSEATNGDMNYKSYEPDGTYISAAITEKSEQLGYEGTDVIRLLAPSATKYVAPYKYCEVELTAQANRVGILSNILQAPDFNWRTYNYFLEGEEVSLFIDFVHEVRTSDGEPHISAGQMWEFRFQIKVGSYYLYKTNASTSGEWLQDSTKYVQYIPNNNIGFIEDSFESTKSIHCPALEEEGDLEMRLIYVGYRPNSPGIEYYRRALDTTTYPDISTTVYQLFHSLQTKLITQNEDHNGKFTYRSTPSSGNSRVKNIKTIIGELDSVVDNISQIYTWNESLNKMIPNGDDRNVRDWGSGVSLIRRLLNSYYETHSKTKEIIVGSVDDTVNRLSYDTVIEWYGKDYMPISLERITGKDRYKGEWIEVGKTVVDNSDDNVDIFYVPTRNGFLGSGVVGLVTDEMLQGTSEQEGTSVLGNLLYSRTYYITNQNYAQILTYTIPEDLSVYKRRSIDDSFILYVNGVRWIYEIEEADVTKAGQFWLEEDTLNWKFFRPITGSVRLEVWDRLIVELDATI